MSQDGIKFWGGATNPSGGPSIINVSATNPLPVNTASGGTGSVNLVQVGGSPIILGANVAAGSLPVALATDQSVSITGTATVSGTVVLGAGTAAIGSLTAGTAIIGKVGIDQTTDGTTNAVHLTAGTNTAGNFVPTGATTTGNSITSTIVANNTTATTIKGSAGTVYAIEVFNNSSTIAYLKVYNATTATAGSGTPAARYMIPAPAAGGGGGAVASYSIGDNYGTGITCIVTTGIADNDSTAPAASTYIYNVHYK